jgi:hypothetical protein
MKPRKFAVKNVPKEFFKDKEKMQRCYEKYRRFTEMRSVVIEAALEIENFLTIVLLHLLVGADYSRHTLLRAFVFEAEFCSFMQKRRMLSMIFEMFPDSFPFLPSKDAKRIRRELNHLILERDMFAHGNLFIDGRTERIFIKYYRGGPVQTELREETVNQMLKRCKYIEEKLYNLNEFLRENRLELPDEVDT